ncbi:MAG: 50S ribosomal protein L4 [Bacilli bacterium]|jgi:50S ribosomal protein L4|nr:50S ribosomal protein L4 [Staphylococcus sp.]CDC71698.1 50S ribosomal protein L4 [Staphylococcus sp. CAG:324]
MPKVVLYNQNGSNVGELELNDHVFGVEDNQQVIYDTVIAERAAMRQGTQKAKTRSEVRGGGRKPWRQKGTGRARQGSIRSPQWRGGGVVFAPTPRSHAIKINKKVVRLAMRCALSSKVRDNHIVVLDQLTLDTFKTKGLVEVLKTFHLENDKVVLALDEANGNVELAGRNLPNVLVGQYNHISVYQMMNAKHLVITKTAVEKFEEVLK